MFKKIVSAINWWINLDSVKNGELNNEVIDKESDVKDNVESLINFSDFKDDIESFMTIDLNKNKYNKKTKRLDLTRLVFWTLKNMFKDNFLDYISHPDFKNLILKVYWLWGWKWGYKINFNSESWKESFVLINISDNRRYSWFSSSEVDWFIVNKLWIKDNSEMSHFIKKTIYWIDESFEKYTWKRFKEFIYSHILKEVEKLLEKNNDLWKIFLEWNDWIIDKELFIKAMAWKIYRDNFDYIHKVAWHKLMSDMPKLVLDELLWSNAENFKININLSFDKIIKFFREFNFNDSPILDIEDECKNDLLLSFQDKIKLYFRKFDKTEIDSELLKWTISFLIENNNLNLKIDKLSTAIFGLLKSNIDDLELLFWKFNWEIIEENWNKYKYNQFRIRDFKNIKWKNSVKKVLSWIKLIIDEMEELENSIKSLENWLEIEHVSSYNYEANIWEKEKILLDYDKKIDLLVLKREDIKKEIENEKEKWFFDKILWKNKKISELENKDKKIYAELLDIAIRREKLEVSIAWFKKKVLELNNWNNKKIRKKEDLKLVLKNKKKILDRIKEDFIRNILFGRELTL